MATEITIKADTMTREQIALLIIGVQLDQHPLFNSRMLGELETYKDGGAVTRHDQKDLKAFFKFAGAFVVSHVKKKMAEGLMKVGVLQDFSSRLYTNAKLAEMEASSRFLLSHNHSAQRVAANIFPVEEDKTGEEAEKSERTVVNIIDIALAAAKETQLPALNTLLKARKAAAEQRLGRPEAKTLG